jgi:hypothetical protein
MRELTKREQGVLSDGYHSDKTYWDYSSYQAGFIAGLEAQDKRVAELVEVIKNFIAYRDAVGPLNFQLEKADDYFYLLRTTIAKYEAEL